MNALAHVEKEAHEVRLKNNRGGDSDPDFLIANGKRYDLAASKLVCSYTNDMPKDDSRHLRERLYLSPNSRWFLIGDGGSDSKYQRRIGDKLVGRTGVVKDMQEREAFRFCQQFASPDVVQEYFANWLLDA